MYAILAWVWIAFWMGRPVHRAGHNGLLVGALVILLWPLGVYLWAKQRSPGPVRTRTGRWIVRGIIAFAVSGLVLLIVAFFSILAVLVIRAL